jgi:hypothetical protein
MTDTGSDSLRSLLNSPREIADEILDLTTLLGVLLAGDDADTCLPGIYRINGILFERATTLKEALQCSSSE